ncbi:MspA family porin [Nocardia mangyaensis]|uniref:MspA family porin n=1 Tax=Nocardia mangyaensis TaxID=2213200 RepID=UPI002674ECF5|nr:MspA family porin [Nocardia mangyaensis]MDO3647336.1 MspA family porin [Nocardia mangyaensis]
MRETTRRARGMFRTLTVATAVAVGLALGNGPASAEIDSTAHIVDGDGLTIEAIQEDTRIEFVPPLDGNPLTREWFHNGTAAFKISGEDADEFEGEITVGYQVGYPASFDGKLTFSWSTPGLELDFDGGGTVDSLIPQAGVELEVGFGPGLETVEAATGEISGDEGFIRMHGFHGTVTGVVGPTNIRPFVTVTSANGDSVTTYGKPWTL